MKPRAWRATSPYRPLTIFSATVGPMRSNTSEVFILVFVKAAGPREAKSHDQLRSRAGCPAAKGGSMFQSAPRLQRGECFLRRNCRVPGLRCSPGARESGGLESFPLFEPARCGFLVIDDLLFFVLREPYFGARNKDA